MSEKVLYLGLEEGRYINDTSYTVNQLVGEMRFRKRTSGVNGVSGVHGAPGIVVPTEAGRVLHPVTGKVGRELLGFPYVFPKLAISAARTPAAERVDATRPYFEQALEDSLIITMAVAPGQEQSIDSIGVPVQVRNFDEREQSVIWSYLKRDAGYTALRTEITPAVNRVRQATLLGVPAEGEPTALPLSLTASSIYLQRTSEVLLGDIAPRVIPLQNPAP